MTLNNGTCRIFIAVQLNDSIKSLLRQSCSEWNKKAEFQKWVHPDDYHITLKFIGDTERSSIDAVISAMENASSTIQPFSLSLSAPGTFGQTKSPSILWYGVSGNVEALRQLHRHIEETVSPLGYPTEKRAYSPHITLARRYNGKSPFNHEAVNCTQTVPSWTVDKVTLFQTHMGRQPMYEAIANVSLGHEIKNP